MLLTPFHVLLLLLSMVPCMRDIRAANLLNNEIWTIWRTWPERHGWRSREEKRKRKKKRKRKRKRQSHIIGNEVCSIHGSVLKGSTKLGPD